jgi:hypothetical protein
MPTLNVQPLGGFTTGRKTATVATAFAIGIPPYGGKQGTPLPTRAPSRATAGRQGIIHVTQILINQATTNQILTWMRPLNWTYFTAVAAAGQAVVTLNADPGLYSASRWRGGAALPNGQTAPATADTAIASGDYCMYQSAAGDWVQDTAASTFSAGVVTMTTNVPTGGTLVGGLFYWFGPPGQNTDPANNLGCPQTGTGFQTLGLLISIAESSGIITTLYPGDPLYCYNPNITTVSVIENIAGYYGKH